jgi:transcriptional regulator with XRE-family HTH domain
MTQDAPGDFDRLFDDIETEAAADGPAGLRVLRALPLKYRLIKRRRSLHWSQKELADHSGIAQSEISKIERGRKSPTIDTYSRLATAMQLGGLMVPQCRARACGQGERDLRRSRSAQVLGRPAVLSLRRPVVAVSSGLGRLNQPQQPAPAPFGPACRPNQIPGGCRRVSDLCILRYAWL